MIEKTESLNKSNSQRSGGISISMTISLDDISSILIKQSSFNIENPSIWVDRIAFSLNRSWVSRVRLIYVILAKFAQIVFKALQCSFSDLVKNDSVNLAALQVKWVPKSLSSYHGSVVRENRRFVFVALIMSRMAFVFQHVALEELYCEVLMRFEENFDDQLVDPAHHD